MTHTEEQSKYLSIYLRDHVAGGTAGSQRAARLAEAESDSADAAALAQFASDVAADLDALLKLTEAMGFAPSRIKSGVALVGEKLGALKPNGHLSERSPLTTIVELEAMQMAVRGKRSLWETLHVVASPSTSVDIDGLITRADHQLAMLSELHAARVTTTLAAEQNRTG
ncbi:MAG TPA: hypothetical protein VGM78_02180 [Ilumatobacteraceae bacterium]